MKKLWIIGLSSAVVIAGGIIAYDKIELTPTPPPTPIAARKFHIDPHCPIPHHGGSLANCQIYDDEAPPPHLITNHPPIRPPRY